ncbi:globin family protein [Pelomonas sp. SE-A7]|uniref:globin family protein n=1 Tax=Pelomonas sp. SE-A7 TaxID=3054953 RepID=UPI00259CBCD8|nr:globin family protein [Pelomonas sp. SE-A7]MDM4764760.1 globin family protein [Pelomonas sp. SE-A7]
MTLTRTQIDLVRHSFALVEPIAPQAAALFYSHLFAADPMLRPMFRGDMQMQGQRLMQMMAAAVSLLEMPEQLNTALRKLGQRHVGYGVQDQHYPTVGAALIRTLSDGLGEQFTPEVRAAWVTMYAMVSQAMMDAAREMEPAAA